MWRSRGIFFIVLNKLFLCRGLRPLYGSHGKRSFDFAGRDCRVLLADQSKQNKQKKKKDGITNSLDRDRIITEVSLQQVDVVMQLSSKLPDLVYKHFFHHCLTKWKISDVFFKKSCYFPFFCGLRACRIKKTSD